MDRHCPRTNRIRTNRCRLSHPHRSCKRSTPCIPIPRLRCTPRRCPYHHRPPHRPSRNRSPSQTRMNRCRPLPLHCNCTLWRPCNPPPRLRCTPRRCPYHRLPPHRPSRSHSPSQTHTPQRPSLKRCSCRPSRFGSPILHLNRTPRRCPCHRPPQNRPNKRHTPWHTRTLQSPLRTRCSCTPKRLGNPPPRSHCRPHRRRHPHPSLLHPCSSRNPPVLNRNHHRPSRPHRSCMRSHSCILK